LGIDKRRRMVRSAWLSASLVPFFFAAFFLRFRGIQLDLRMQFMLVGAMLLAYLTASILVPEWVVVVDEPQARRRFRWDIVASTALLLAVYPIGYYQSVRAVQERPRDGVEVIVRPSYPGLAKNAESDRMWSRIFAPGHWIDRRFRPHVWSP